MPGFVVTRGLGPGATPTNLIARGFLVSAVAEVVRGAVRRGRRAKQQFADLIEELKVRKPWGKMSKIPEIHGTKLLLSRNVKHKILNF